MAHTGVRVLAVVCASAALAVAGCVDNAENARQFCDRHADLLDRTIDDVDLDGGAASDIEDEIERTMRDAEDATRPVRGAARDLVKAYGEVADEAGNDDPGDGLATARRELLEARRAMREACGDLAR